MIRPQEINEDGLPVLNWNHNDDGLPVLAAPKKKDTGSLIGLLGSKTATSGNQSPEEESDPAKAILDPIKQKIDFSYLMPRSNVDATAVQKPVGYNDPTANNIQRVNNAQIANQTVKAVNDYGQQKEILKQKFFPDVNQAKDYLANTPDPNNQTAQLAKEKINDFTKVKDAIDKSGDLVSAAINNQMQDDPQFAKQVAVLMNGQPPGTPYQQVMPQSVIGRSVYNFLNDPAYGNNVSEAIKGNPKLEDEYNTLKGHEKTIFPDFGVNVVANQISRERQKRGLNSAVANFNTGAFNENTDKVASDLFKNDPESMKLYNDIIKPDKKKYIDVPGFLNRAEGSIERNAAGTVNTVKSLTGNESDAERQFRTMNEENTQVSAGETGWTKAIGDIGDFGGLIGYMGGFGNLARGGLGMSGGTANKLMTGLTFGGPEMDKAASLYPGEKWKQLVRAGSTTGAYMLASDLFPGSKVADAVSGKVGEGVDDIISKVDSGELTQQAAKQSASSVFQKAIQYGKDVTGHIGKGVGEMAAITGFDQLQDNLLGLNKDVYKQVHNGDELIDVAKSMALGLLLPSMASAYGDVKNRGIVKDNIYEMADNPMRFQSMLEAQRTPDNSGETDEKISKLQFLSKTKQTLDENNIPEDRQKSYLLHALNEKSLTNQLQDIQQKASQIEDPLLRQKEIEKTQPIQKQIEQSQKIKDKIFNGEKVSNQDEIPQDEVNLKKPPDNVEPGIAKPEPQAEEKPNPEIEKINQERNDKIDEAHKPEIKLSFIKPEELAASNDPIKLRQEHSFIRNKLQELKSIMDCIWG